MQIISLQNGLDKLETLSEREWGREASQEQSLGQMSILFENAVFL